MKAFWSSFLGSALGTLSAILVTSVLSILILFAIIGGLAKSAESGKTENVQENSVLHLKLDYPLPDRSSDDPFANFDPVNFSMESKAGLNDLLLCLKAAQKDDKIKGLFLDLSVVQMGMASAEELRKGLLEFKKSGKFMYTYSENLDQRGYYLASAGDKIYLDPMGGVEFKGISAGFMSFKSAMDKIGLKAVILRPDSNKFKSAVEPFFLEKMSPENRAQTGLFIHSAWNEMLNAISESRKIDTKKLHEIADNLTAFDTDGALTSGLIDKIAFRSEFNTDLKKAAGLDSSKKLHLVTPETYSSIARNQLKNKDKDKIAVLYALGPIEGGKGDENTIGSEGMSDALQKIRKDESIKALVLRINSPGGSAQASEIIWHELELTKKKMPVIVSMGDYAASGGYYIACNADSIIADANTLTGSIGVFGLLINTREMFDDKIGLKSDTVNTNRNADFYNSNRDLTETESAVLTKSVNKTYRTFLQRVADGRGMTTQQVDAIAQGRIWSGRKAKELGLVDEIGDMQMAIEIAAKKAGLSEYQTAEYPEREKSLEKFFGKKTEEIVEKAGLSFLTDHYKFMIQLKKMNMKNGVQARLPYSIEIR
jgi:protease-4